MIPVVSLAWPITVAPSKTTDGWVELTWSPTVLEDDTAKLTNDRRSDERERWDRSAMLSSYPDTA